MAINSATGAATTGTAAAVTSAAETAGLGFASDMQTFLKLLTTQLQNQDPMSPMDAQQLTAQIAQLSAVEQQIAANRNLEALIGLQQSSQLLSATPLVGQWVEVESSQLVVQGGSATLRLPAGTGTAMVTITDASGTVLRQEPVTLGTAEQYWSWDGLTNGKTQLPDGAYSVSVTRASETDGTTPVEFGVVGLVTGVARDTDGVLLSLGGLDIDLSMLSRVVPQS
jgi:flagellar basal-body rod modification protein FlgD